MPAAPAKAVELFYSYVHKDEDLRNQLAEHLSSLRRQGYITEWYDRQIGAGTEWVQEINAHLNTATIILLLISSSFLASDYCYGIEMHRALERHDTKEALVIPIILRPVDWQGTPFEKLQALPANGKPITTWPNQDEAFLDVTRGIRKAIEVWTTPPSVFLLLLLRESTGTYPTSATPTSPVRRRSSPTCITSLKWICQQHRRASRLSVVWAVSARLK